MKKELTLNLDSEVIDWLNAQPEHGATWVTELVREQLRQQPPPVAPKQEELSGDALRALALTESLEPAVRARLTALIRYPQLIDAVARGYVTVERAEEMAQEADTRNN